MQFKKSFLPLFFVLPIVLTFSCNDDPGQFGLDVLPDEDKISVSINDTIQVFGEQTLIGIEELSSSDLIYLGAITDTLQGEIKASVITQLHVLSGKRFDYKLISKDSIVSFTMHFKPDTNFVGKSNASVEINLYELTKKMSTEETYTYQLNIDDYIAKNAPLKSFSMNSEGIKKGLKVELPLNFAETFLQFDTTQLYSLANHYNGICFLPLAYTNKGLMAAINVGYTYTNNPTTYLNLKYIYQGKTDSLVFSLASNIQKWNGNVYYENAKANLFSRDYTKAQITSGINGNANDSLLYIFGKGGYKVKYNMLPLSAFSFPGRITIAKAEIIVPYENKLLTGSYVNSATIYGKKDSLYYSSIFVKDTVSNEFRLDITDFVQNYIKNPANYKELVLSFGETTNFLHSAIINKNKKTRLKIKYTTF